MDEAIAAWGNFVENELSHIEGKTSKDIEQKQLLHLNFVLGLETDAPGRFRDPASMFG